MASERSTRRRLPFLPNALLGLAVIALTLGLWWVLPPVAAAGSSRHVEINLTLRQWGYDPGIITVNQGDQVTLHLHSNDVTHGFYLDAYGVQQEVNPAKDETVTFTADKPGRFMFRCFFTCGSFHPYMTGWLRVTPNHIVSGGTAMALAFGAGFFVFLGWEAVKK